MIEKLKQQGYLVFDDLLPDEECDRIYNELCHSNFPWYIQPKTINPNDKESSVDGDIMYMSHSYFNNGSQNSSKFLMALALLNEFSSKTGIQVTSIIRCQSNLTFPHAEKMVTPQHTDQIDPHYVLIYYVSDSDGETVIYKDGTVLKSVSPKKGRFLIFDGSLFHSGVTPVVSEKRIIFNYNLVLDETKMG